MREDGVTPGPGGPLAGTDRGVQQSAGPDIRRSSRWENRSGPADPGILHSLPTIPWSVWAVLAGPERTGPEVKAHLLN